jgi:hypothetical protein
MAFSFMHLEDVLRAYVVLHMNVNDGSGPAHPLAFLERVEKQQPGIGQSLVYLHKTEDQKTVIVLDDEKFLVSEWDSSWLQASQVT